MKRRDLRRQERIRGRGSTISSGSQCGHGLEELEPTHRNDATTATRRRLGLATIVPLDAGKQTNRTPTRVPAALACSWLDNSPHVAQQSYLLVTEEDFARAARVAKVMVEGRA